MIALARGSNSSSSNSHSSSASAKHSSAAWLTGSRTSTHDLNVRGSSQSSGDSRFTAAARHASRPVAIPLNVSSGSTGLKIRIPRDLPNLPEAFRKRGAIRSQPAAAAGGQGGAPAAVKRTHSAMLQEDQAGSSSSYVSYVMQGEGPRIKIIRRQPPAPGSVLLPPHLAGSRNLAIRTGRDPVSVDGASSSFSQNNGSLSTLSSVLASTAAAVEGEGPDRRISGLPTSVQKHRRHSKSKSGSPHSSTSRTPSPTARSNETTVVLPSPSATVNDSSRSTVVIINAGGGVRSSDGATSGATAGSGTATTSSGNTVSNKEEQSLSLVTNTSAAVSSDGDSLKPIELVRVGMAILGRLISNTFSKSFINKVPATLTNYHLMIKKPMDLTTIEHKLYKTVALTGAHSGSSSPGLVKAADWLSMGVAEGYSTLEDFERDLRRIFQNATFFNSPTHVIYKDAQEFQNTFSNLLSSYRQGKLIVNIALPQESFRPELISLSEPGPLYIFRAHTLREMERKMTDISIDLFASFHQPIFDISTEQIGQLSPEYPRFVRMYINKNRSILAKSRDERFARVAILSDYQVGKPYMVSSSSAGNPTGSSYSPGARSQAPAGGNGGGVGSGGSSVSMVRMTAKVLIGKPIGERQDMVTVGDLDCPNAWITVACVRALEIDIEVPVKFDKILAKMRHEVVAYSSDSKIAPEHQRIFADALGLLLPSFGKTGQAGQAYSPIGQRSAIPTAQPPPSAATAPTTPAAPAAAAAPASATASLSSKSLGLGITTPDTPASITTATPKYAGKDERLSKAKWVDLHDHGPSGQYLVKMRVPHLLKSSHRPASVSATTSVSAAAAPPHAIAVSMPSTPLLPTRLNVLSSQIPATPSSASGMESLSAPDRIMLKEQITKRGHKMLMDLKLAAEAKKVPYSRWSDIEPTLTVDSAHGLFKRIYHVRGEDGLVVQNFKEMDAESFEQRVREVACLLKLRDLEGVGQIQSIIDDEENHLVGLSMTKYAYTLKQYATNARRHPTPSQKLCLVRDMVSAMCAIHQAGLAHRDLSEVNIMVDEDQNDLLEDQSARPHVKVIDFGKSVFVERDEVQRWSTHENVSEEELALLPMVVLPPDHGYKLYRSILTLPKNKHDHTPLPPVDPRSEDVYSLGVLIWRTFSGKSPWNGAIEDDLKTIRYLVSSDAQIRFQLEKEIKGEVSRELLLRCLTARAETRSTTLQLKEWLDQPQVAHELLKEFEALGGGRKKVRKNLD
ncbi:hypothetical protein EDD11_003538 [Mortierella claussenii]|nr:hypothetical protein EDD11_003538 [Mortierella claussenii]